MTDSGNYAVSVSFSLPAVQVSIIVAVLNGAQTLPRLLDSIASQTFRAFELIIHDGGSTDGTCAILASREREISHWDSAADTGIYEAWNTGLDHAHGSWVCFLGCDDALHGTRALQDMYESACAVPAGTRIVYGKVDLLARNGRRAETIGEPWSQARQAFFEGFMIPHPGAFHRRSSFVERGGFDPSYKLAGDYEFLLRELLDGEARYVDRVIVDMTLGGATARPESIYRGLLEVQRARRSHGLTDTPRRLRAALAMAKLGALVHRVSGDRTFRLLADAYRLVRGRPRIWTA